MIDMYNKYFFYRNIENQQECDCQWSGNNANATDRIRLMYNNFTIEVYCKWFYYRNIQILEEWNCQWLGNNVNTSDRIRLMYV